MQSTEYFLVFFVFCSFAQFEQRNRISSHRSVWTKKRSVPFACVIDEAMTNFARNERYVMTGDREGREGRKTTGKETDE